MSSAFFELEYTPSLWFDITSFIHFINHFLQRGMFVPYTYLFDFHSLLFRQPSHKQVMEVQAIQHDHNYTQLDFKQASSTPLPPRIDNNLKKECLNDYLNATEQYVSQQLVCAICGELSFSTTLVPLDSIPNKELLTKAYQHSLPEYKHHGMCLVTQGIQQNKINCCTQCYNTLARNKLPDFSVANNFQLGSIPDVLRNLTIPEKIMISAYRPHMSIIKLKEICGPGTAQFALRGNSITFPQDVNKIASSLPLPIDELPSVLHVIFIGTQKPTKVQLKDTLQVRRMRIIRALEFLKKNHPHYKNITFDQSAIQALPNNDIPQPIWNTLTTQTENLTSNNTGCATNDLESLLQENPASDDDNNIPSTFIEHSGIIDINTTTVSSDTADSHAAQQLCTSKALLIPHSSEAIKDFTDTEFWVSAYPYLFAFGTGSKNSELTDPKTSISLQRWIKHLLLFHDRRFATSPQFLLHVFNVIQKKNVCLQTSLLLQQNTDIDDISTISPDDLASAISSLANKEIPQPRIQKLLRNVKSVGKKIQGSPYQRQTFRREIQSLMISLGLPAYFITINPADIHHPIVCFLAGENIKFDELTPDQIPSARNRAKLARDNPVAAAQFFHIVIDAFLKTIVRFGSYKKGIFGTPTAYYGCTEEQGRGTLHFHMMLWVDWYNSPTEFHEKMRHDETFRDNILQFLQEVIFQHTPDTSNPKQPFDHTSTTTNLISSDSSTSDTTKATILEENTSKTTLSCDERYKIMIQHPNWENDNFEATFYADVSKLASSVNTHSHTFTCYKYSHDNCRFEYPRALVFQSKYDVVDGIQIQRFDKWINNFNDVTLSAIRANMDIKFIGSGVDSKSLAFYITDYQTKSQLTTHNVLPLFQSAILKNQQLQAKTQGTPTVLSSAKTMIIKCLNKLATHVELSAAHVASLLLGYTDNKSSHKFQPLHLYNFLSILPLQNEEKEHSTETRSIEKGNHDSLVLVNSRLDYICRGSELNSICLYDFTANWLKHKKDKASDRENSNRGRPKNPRVPFLEQHPQAKTHHLQKVSEPFIPSLPAFAPTEQSNPEKFAQFMLILFKPFRTTEDILQTHTTCSAAYSTYEFSKSHQALIENIKEMSSGYAEKQKLDAARNQTSNDDVESTVHETPDFADILDPLNSDDDDYIDHSMTTDDDLDPNNMDIQTQKAVSILKRYKLDHLQVSNTKFTSCAKFPVLHPPKLIQQWKKEIQK